MTARADLPGLIAATSAERARTRRLVTANCPELADPDPARFGNYTARLANARSIEPALEAVQGKTTDFQPVAFLMAGDIAQRAVGYVEVMVPGRSCSGTGFLISPGLLITNQHVIEDAAAAAGAQVTFDRQADASGRPLATTTYRLDPDSCALFSPEAELDYAIVALGERLSGSATPQDLGYLPLSGRSDKQALGVPLNIVQHPLNLPKQIAIRNNLLTARTSDALLYETDTEHGSSGSPVFNDLWEVVALHHAGAPSAGVDEAGQPIPRTVNEGLRISAIVADLTSRLASVAEPAAALVRTALALGEAAANTARGGKVLGPPPARAAEAMTPAGGQTMAQGSTDATITIPIELTIRVGAGGTTAVAAPQVGGGDRDIGGLDGPAQAPVPAQPGQRAAEKAAPKRLRKPADTLRINPDYAARVGYRPDFIDGVTLPFPQPGEGLKDQVAALRGGEPDGESGLLRYTHFSLIVHRLKRIAIVTATNIDGPTFLSIDRKTGKVREAAEAETWFNDPRISTSFTLTDDFYPQWSEYFDHGHLTRRTDVNWGNPAEAQDANADTYHFTNSSPQHYLFNQSSDYWQGVERYVLENGAIGGRQPSRLSVFQGPIFNDKIDRTADGVQIPSSFFKIVVWRSPAGPLKSVGLVVDQLELLDIRRGEQSPARAQNAQVNQWRVPIATIAAQTGLLFAPEIAAADTIGTSAQPQVGEARTRLTGFEDIRL
jgi:endonuclease G